ncbi:MAG: hypothetical protein V3V08_06715 [Nannocystaceae bacterium]
MEADHDFSAYQAQDSELTLREGIEEYFARNPGLTKVTPGDPSAELFLPHDACHVLFGTNTSLVEEGMTDMWTLLGSDVGLRRYAGFTKYLAEIDPEGLSRKFGYLRMTAHFFFGVPAMLRATWRGWRMTKKWCWDDYEAQLGQTLGELRREHGIKVLRAPGWSLAATAVGPEPHQLDAPRST